MDELDRLLERAADRGAPRGSGRVWAGAVAAMERADASLVTPVDEPGVATVADDPNAATPSRRGVRLLAVAATVALLVAGAAVRWSALRSSTSGPSISVGITSDPPTSTVTTSDPSTTAASAVSSVTAVTTVTAAQLPPVTTALSGAPHYLPGRLPDGYRMWDITPSPSSDGRTSLRLDLGRPGGAVGHASVLVEPTSEGAIEVLAGQETTDVDGRAAVYEGQPNVQWLFFLAAPRIKVTVAAPDSMSRDELVAFGSSVRAVDDATFATAVSDVDQWVSSSALLAAHAVGDVAVEVHDVLGSGAASALCIVRRDHRSCRALVGDALAGAAYPSQTIIALPFELDPGVTSTFGRIAGAPELAAGHLPGTPKPSVAAPPPTIVRDPDDDQTWFRFDLPTGSPSAEGRIGSAQQPVGGFSIESWHPPVPPAPPAGDALGRRTIGFFGDSTGLMTGIGAQGWGVEHGVQVLGDAKLGCPLLYVGEIRYPGTDGTVTTTTPGEQCNFESGWRAYLDTYVVDLAVIQFGPFDVADHRLPGDDEWHHLGEAEYDRYVRRMVEDAVGLFTGRGIPVAWLAAPHVALGTSPDYPGNDPARMDRFNALVREVVAKYPTATMVDLPGYLAGHLPGGESDAAARPDGVHFTAEAASTIATDWLGPELLRRLPA